MSHVATYPNEQVVALSVKRTALVVSALQSACDLATLLLDARCLL